MHVLLGDINLWSLDEDINIKDTDFGAFKYYDKRIDGLYEDGKRSYCEKRGMVSVLQNKKGNKLKDGIKYLEEQLRDHSTVYCQWYDGQTVQLMLSTGLLIYIQVNVPTADIQKIMFDKYLVGKVSDHISDVIMTKNHLAFTHNDSQITVVQFTKPKRLVFDKISKLEPRMFVAELSGPSGRKQDKKICVNRIGDLILVWWKSTMNEVYPWSPAVKDHDRSNVHLYRLTGIKFELVCYLRTEFDPLCITFNSRHDNVIHSVEQKVSRKGEVTIEWQTYEVSQHDKLQRVEVISVPLPTHTSCAKFSPNQDMLLLCCIDGSITIHDHKKGTSNSVKSPFIPTLASWHSDGFLFTVGNDRGQFQHYDISLACMKSQMLNEDSTPAIIFDLSTYFRSQPALMRMIWNKKTDPGCYSNRYDNGDALFLLLFERGPLGVIRIVEGNNLSGDVLICRSLNVLNVERATSLLLSMNWDTHPRACMHSLNQILNHLFKLKLTPDREALIQNSLGSFHVPVRPISQAVEDEYGDEIRDLTRRFFHHLIRYRLFEKAFRLAIDLNDHDLFMDIHFYALVMNDTEMAKAAKEKAESVLSRSNSCSSSHSTCSRASCSLCTDSMSEKDSESYSGESESEGSPKITKSKIQSSKQFSKGTPVKNPSLPMVNPTVSKNIGLSSTSFADDDPEKSENLMSTAFNLPTTSDVHKATINSPLVMPKAFPSVYAKRSPCRTASGIMSSLGTNSQSYNNLSDDLISSAFGNLRLLSSNQRERSLAKSVGNVCHNQRRENEFSSVTIDDDCSVSTRFGNVAPDLGLDMPMTSGSSLLGNIDGNLMSTSFGNLTLNSICETGKSTLYRNGNSTVRSTMENPHVNFGNSSSTSKTTTSYSGTMSKPNTLGFFKSSNNLMSTSFNDLENDGLDSLEDNLDVDIPDVFDDLVTNGDCSASNDSGLEGLPPPPTMTASLANYLNSLPKKNVSMSRSVNELDDIDDGNLKFPITRLNVNPQMLQRQSSVSSILQSQHRNNNFQPIRNYRLNYDLDYVPFYGSSENLDYQSTVNYGDDGSVGSIGHFKSHYNSQSKSVESKNLRLGTTNVSSGKETKLSFNVSPPVNVVNPSNAKSSQQCQNNVDSLGSNEKPKVKFSNTVTHILVPTTGQTYRPIQKRSVTQLHPMDPKRELAESLPLCLGNEDYLKDFQPLSRDAEIERAKENPKMEEAAKIKVVHFGLL